MKILVAAWIGGGNLGDELVFEALRRKLESRGITVAVTSVDPSATATGAEVIPDRNVVAVRRAVGAADAVVLGGGGLLQDETSPWNLPWHLSKVWMARSRGRPVAVVGVGAGPLTRGGRALLRRSLAGARAISVRDQASAEALAAAGVAGAVVAADLAVSLPSPEVPPEDRIVVAVRPYLTPRRPVPASWRYAWRGVNQDQAERFARALDRVGRAAGLPVRLVTFHPARDGALHNAIAARMSTEVDVLAPRVAEVLEVVARSRVVVGMRYHAGVAAVLGRRPAVLLAYSSKVTALGGDTGAAVLPAECGEEELARAVARALEDPAPSGRLERLRERERGNDRVLDELLSSA